MSVICPLEPTEARSTDKHLRLHIDHHWVIEGRTTPLNLGRMRVKQITPEMVNAWYRAVQDEKGEDAAAKA